MFGLSPQWLVHHGKVFPSRIVLSHPEQLRRLALDCPEAVPAAVVAGDPCLDRMLASMPWRDRYRRRIGVEESAKLVVVSSTWGHNSLFGRHGDLMARMLAELPLDEYRVAAALHPNVWHGHSPWQIRSWLARCERAGMLLIPPRDGWRAALVAADLVIGDHGSVTFYGAVLGHPVMLATFPDQDVDPRSPVGRFGRTAPRLALDRPLLPQLKQVLASHDQATYDHLTAEATSVPGESARLLRAEAYRLLGIDEPSSQPSVLRVPEPEIDPAVVTAAFTTVSGTFPLVMVQRWPAAGVLGGYAVPRGVHLVVDEEEPETRLLDLADVLTRTRFSADEVSADDDPIAWLDQTLERRTGAYLACVAVAPGESLVRSREGMLARISQTDSLGGALLPAGVHASILYGWLAGGHGDDDLPDICEVWVGSRRAELALKVER